MNKVGKTKFALFALVTAASTLLSSTFAAGPWTGKKVSVLGDSYSTFAGVSGDPANDSLPAGDSAGCREYENNPFYPGDVSILESQTWWRQVLASLGGTLERNNSVGGSEITRDAGGSVGIPVDGRNLIRSFVHRAANGGLGNPDVILVLGGTNDGWHDLDPSSFKNGVATLFAALKSDYPNAQVVVLVPAQENDSARIAGISTDLRAVLLNGAAGSGFLSVDLDEVGFVADDFKYGHPKASGMTKIADKVIAAVNAAPTFYKTLETDGRGYILTDYQPKTSRSRIEYDLRFLYLGLSVGLGIANGTSSSGAANAYEWGGYFNAENRTFTYYTEPGGAGASFGAGFDDTSVRHTIAMGQGKVTLDDQTTSIATPAEDWTTGGKFALFAVNYGGTTFSSRAIVRVAGIRVFEGETVVRSWVPAKDANGTATLYDLVNKKFETVKAGVFSVDDTADPTWAAQAANSWTVQPSVPSSVTAGTLPTISLGAAKCGNGTQTATYTAKDIQNLPAGTYTQVVEVESTAGYRGLRAELEFTVTGTVPTAASVAPRAVAPLGGASVATHTAKQKEFIGLPAAQRKRVLAVLYERERAEYAANDGHPQPVRLQWNGGDGECTVKVYRGNETTPVQTHVVVTRWTDGNFFDLDNLEVGQAYRWTVSNAKGTAEGAFVTESETPRLFNAGIIGNTRDLGGYVGMDGRRVRQGMFLRSRCFDTNNKKTYASVLTATEVAFFRDFIGLKTEIDLRGETWITQSFVPGVTTHVNMAWPLDYTGAYLTDATKKSAMKAALDPIFDAAKYPIDVHCHSGQDRTGMYCFILEALLGVSEADCIRDWEWSALGNSAFNTGDTYQLDSFLSKFRTLNGATTQAKAETFMRWLGYSSTLIDAFREIMLEPATPVHEHTPVAVPAVAATYVKPGRTAGTKCSECGEILSAGEVIPVIASRPTCSAQVAADGKAKLEFANVLAPVVVSVVYGDEDCGDGYFDDSGWDHWEVVAFVPAGTTSYEEYAIPGWGTTATQARFLVTPYEQTPKATLETVVATDPAAQVLDTGFSPNGGTRLNMTMKLGVDPADKTLVDTPSDAAGALAYGISFDASRHPVYAYDSATYAVNAAAANGNDVRFYMNLDESGKTGWRTKIGSFTYFAAGKPSAPSAKTTDGTIRVHGLGAFSPITIADAQGATQAYFAPVTGFDAEGNEIVGFLDSISMTMHVSVGSAAFAKGPAYADYHKDLLANVTMLTATETMEFHEPTPEPDISDYWAGKLKFAPAKTIVCYGDSLTAGTMADTVTISADNYFDGRMNGVSGAESYPYQLAKMIPGEYNVIAQARGSRTTDAIVSWAGGVPVKSVAAITLPAAADAEVSAGFPNFLYNGTDPGYMYEYYKDSPSKTEEEKNRYYGLQIPDYALFEANPVAGAPAGDVIPGWFGGVHVQLHHTRANERTISRTEAGAAVTVPAGSAFIPDSVVSLKDSVAVFFAGSNDRSLERKDEVIAMLKDGVANYTRHVVLSPYEEGFLAVGETSVQTTPTGFEREMAAAFEDHYLNLRLELATHGLDLAVALGRMSPAQAAGKTWREGLISSDGVHLSSTGYAVLARLVKEKLQQLEYLPADPEPAYGELFDYLQTDGAGYIRTGVVPNLRTTRVEMTFVLGNSEKDQTFCFASEAVASAAGGTSIPGNGNEFGLAYYAALNFGTKTSPDKHPGFQYYCEGLGEAKFLKDFADTAGKHVFELGGATLKVDGAEIATTGTPNDGTAGGELVLFTTTFGKGLTNFADARIYSIRIYEADALAHDYRPCTDKSGRAGLWDAKTNAVLLPTSDGFVAANDPASAWTQPAEDTPEAVAVALAADGFDAVTQTAISTSAERTPLEAYAAFRTYCVETLGLVDPKDAAKAGVKANALLGYALGAESVPDEAVASGDVEIVSVERDAGAVVVGVAVRGVEPHADKAVQSALDAVVAAMGGEKVTAMSAETVSVSGTVRGDALSVTVTPKRTGADAFFVRIVIRNGRTEE